jgi:hypothetical protein
MILVAHYIRLRKRVMNHLTRQRLGTIGKRLLQVTNGSLNFPHVQLRPSKSLLYTGLNAGSSKAIVQNRSFSQLAIYSDASVRFDKPR